MSAVVEDGWDEDLNFDDDDEEQAEEAEAEGWGDDDDLNFDHDDDEGAVVQPQKQQNTVASYTETSSTNIQDNNNKKTDEWDFDDEIMDDDNDDDEEELNVPKQQPPPMHHPLYDSLQQYISSLPRMLPSLNAVLAAEYNTPQHAQQLLHYYQNRPQLHDYTLHTELDRMTYKIRLNDTTTMISDKQQVKHILQQQQSSLLTRCANQSLLADIVSVLTGADSFVRPQYLASVVATHVLFEIDINNESVYCECDLLLSLPHSSNDRLNICELHTSVEFAPLLQSIHYELKHVNMLFYESSDSSLHETAIFLEPLVVLHPPTIVSNNNDQMRDSLFLQLSKTQQQLYENTSVGFKSAMRQMDAVVNVGQKVEFLKKIVPSKEQILLAEEEESSSSSSHAHYTTAPPPPPWRAMGGGNHVSTEQQTEQQSRPKPILSGFLRSGWSRLAKSVTLPDEEQQQQQEEVIPSLYRKQQEPTQAAVPQLHRKEGPTQAAVPPRHQVQLKPQASPPTTRDTISALAPPTEHEEDEIVQDGWDDDLEGLDEDEQEQEKLVPPQPPARSFPSMVPTARPEPAGQLLKPRISEPQPMANDDPAQDNSVVPTRKRWVNPYPGPRRLMA